MPTSETIGHSIWSPDVQARRWNTAVAVGLLATAMWQGYTKIGVPPVVIVGGSGLVALIIWSRTYLRRPTDPAVILPLFLLTVAALDLHMTEEYLAGFGPAMSRLFDISWTERSFLLIFAFAGPTIYALTRSVCTTVFRSPASSPGSSSSDLASPSSRTSFFHC
jgi:hypothetical protein